MTLQVAQNEIKILYKNPDDYRRERATTVKYPCITMDQIMYVANMIPPNDDIANCIYLSYNPITQAMLHTHVYRFDSPSTASTFVKLINRIVETPSHQAYVSDVEEKLRHTDYLQAVVEKPLPQTKIHR